MQLDLTPVEPWLNFDGTEWVWLDGTRMSRVRGGSDGGTPPGFDPSSGTITLPPEPSANGGGQQGQGGPPEGYYTEEQLRERLNQARSEERDKLYGNRSQEQRELEELRAFRSEQERLRQEQEAEAQRQAAEQQRQAEEQRRQAEQEELSAKDLIARREAELRAEMDAQRAHYDAELARRDAILEKEREFQALQTYRAQVIAANQENILPEFLDYIDGDSQQAIDASVQRAIERTQSVVQNFRQVAGEQQRGAPGVSTRAPAVGPESMVAGQRTYSAEDIASWSMADYMKNRHLLPPGRAGGSDRGLF